MDLNKAMLIGRLTRDPEAKVTPQGQNLSQFSVATNLVWTDANGQRQEKTEFHNIVAWRKLAETCNQYLKKGSRLYIEGRLQTRSWQDQNGVTKYRTEIVADSMIMLDRRSDGDARPSGNSGQNFPSQKSETEPMNAPSSPPQPAGNLSGGNNAPQEEEVKLEDIPF
ncbi:MAG: single-stranded DNA-binding protein [Parcubacteria group bacterium]|nr:single-stranded DNA-binding protein [Parcubacteria group bacterium]